MKKREESIHIAVAGYIRMQYPDVILRTDFAAGIKMTMFQAVKHKNLQSSRAYPDLFIAWPSTREAQHGAFIELKKEGTQLKRQKDAAKVLKGEYTLRKAGDWYDSHIEEQANMLKRLDSLGYFATFAVGFDEAVRLIKQYLGGANDEKFISKNSNQNDLDF